MTKTILLLSAASGYGHIRAGQYLSDGLKAATTSYTIRHDNLCDCATPSERWLIEGLWEMASTTPGLRSAYSASHRFVTGSDVAASLMRLLFRRVGRRLAQKHSGEEVVAVLALHPGAAAAASFWKQRSPFFLGVVATDFLVHSVQVLSGVDHVFASPWSFLQGKRARAFADRGAISWTGLPVHQDFFASPGKAFGAPLRSIVFSFGANGYRARRHLSLIELVARTFPAARIDIACGLNRPLWRSLRDRFRALSNVSVLSFQRDMLELMTNADVLIGKAGGLSTGEAIASRTPIIVVDVLPGQEEHNANALVASRFGVQAKSAEEVITVLHSLRQFDFRKAAPGEWGVDTMSKAILSVIESSLEGAPQGGALSYGKEFA